MGSKGHWMRYGMYAAVFLAGLTSFGTQAFIYELKVMRKWDEAKQTYRYFIGCSDFHDKTSPVNQTQQQVLNTALQQCDRAKTKILIEDLSSVGSGGRLACGRYQVNSRGGILGGLAEKCRCMGLEVDNVEYRYCRVSSLGPVLNNLNQRPKAFPSVAGTTVAVLANEIDAIVQEITTYTDGPILEAVYQHNIKQVQPQLTHFKNNSHKDMSVAEYLESHSKPKERLEFLKHLLTFDSCLLDLKMAHAICAPCKAEKVVAIAGGAHIARVSELLEKVGYEVVYASDTQYKKECDLTKCLGSNIVDGAYCIHPEPIDLEQLVKYL
jgi:hypothetical protein